MPLTCTTSKGQENTFCVRRRETATKTSYINTIIPPIDLVIFHLKVMIAMMTINSMRNSIPMEHPIPADVTFMDSPPWLRLHKSQGKGNPTVTSKMLDPMDDDTAISPWPCLATRTDVMRSGTDVPAARTVRPITASEIPTTLPKMVAHQLLLHLDHLLRLRLLLVGGGGGRR